MRSNIKKGLDELDEQAMQSKYEELLPIYNLRDLLRKLSSKDYLNKKNFRNIDVAKRKLIEIYKQHLREMIDEIIEAHKDELSRGKALLLIQGIPDVVENSLGKGKVDSTIIQELQEFWNSYIIEEIKKYYEEHPEARSDDEEAIEADRRKEELRKQGLDFYGEVKSFTNNFSFLADSNLIVDAEGKRKNRVKFKSIENGIKFIEVQNKITDIMKKMSVNEKEAIRLLIFSNTESTNSGNKTIKLPTIDAEEMSVLVERYNVLVSNLGENPGGTSDSPKKSDDARE